MKHSSRHTSRRKRPSSSESIDRRGSRDGIRPRGFLLEPSCGRSWCAHQDSSHVAAFDVHDSTYAEMLHGEIVKARRPPLPRRGTTSWKTSSWRARVKMHMIPASLRPAVDFHGFHPSRSPPSLFLVGALSRPFRIVKEIHPGMFTRDYFWQPARADVDVTDAYLPICRAADSACVTFTITPSSRQFPCGSPLRRPFAYVSGNTRARHTRKSRARTKIQEQLFRCRGRVCVRSFSGFREKLPRV